MPLARWWIAFVLACALVGAQSLAFVHRVVHPGYAHSLVAVQAGASLDASFAGRSDTLATLFIGHDADGPVCHLFDAAAPDGMPSILLAIPAMAPAVMALPVLAAACVQRQFRQFDARGPPAGY